MFLSMKKLVLKFFTVVLLIFLISSCDNVTEDINLNNQNSSSDKMSLSARNILDEDIRGVFNQEISYGEIRSFELESEDLFFKEVLNSNGIVIGYVDENNGKYGVSDIRSTDIHRYVDLKSQKEYIFDINYSNAYNRKMPDFELYANNQANTMMSSGDNRCMANFLICSTTASLAAIAIAASDGPLPFMDAVAVSTYIAANALCVSNYDLCKNPPKST